MELLESALSARANKINKIESIKASKSPMDVYDRLHQIADGGYDELAKEDSSYFLKCFGLYDKGSDFMLRIRIPAGQLSSLQARTIGKLAQKYGNDYIDITTRMQIQLRYIPISDIANLLEELDAVGVSTFQTGVDNPRNIVTDPLDGIAYDNIITTKPIIDELQAIFAQNPDWVSVLPRKFNTGILGSLSNSCNIFGHDCCFVLAQKDGIFGFNIYLGARVGVQAKDANLFVATHEVALFFSTLLNIFRDYGYRDNRNKNRLVWLINDVGMESFISAIKQKANYEFQEAGTTMVQSQSIAQNSSTVLGRNGKLSYKIVVPSGIFSGSDMMEVADIADRRGDGDIRLTYDQNIYITNIERESLEQLSSNSLIERYNRYNNTYFLDMIACAGRQTCSFGVIDNKPDAIAMANYLNSQVALSSATVRMNWSGCPKGCGVHGIADIGFEGCKAKDSDGNRVDGVHILIGGKITKEAREAKILHKSLPIEEAKYHVKYLLKSYATHRLRGESYESYDDRYLSYYYSLQAIKFYTLINYILNDKLDLMVELELDKLPKTYKKESFEVFDFGLKLYKLLTKENRFTAVEEFQPALIKPRKIAKNEITKLNPKVPELLSEAIYTMTHEDSNQRASVFSEVIAILQKI